MRDYIGSADAYNIFIGSYDPLIRSKLKDSSFMSARMQRGLNLETDVLEQYAAELAEYCGFEMKEILSQVRYEGGGSGLTKLVPKYCKSTCDGVATYAYCEKVVREIWEVKTSEADCPETEVDLKLEYPKYYYQVQWQMWCSGLRDATVVWCKCPPIDSGESAYNDRGELEIHSIEVEYDESVAKVFAENAPRFWEKWEEARDSVSSADISSIVPIDEYVELQLKIEETTKALAAETNNMRMRVDEIRGQILKAMADNNVLKYETDDLSISYIAPSTKKIVDTAKLKADGIYDSYTKESKVSESVRITMKKKED